LYLLFFLYTTSFDTLTHVCTQTHYGLDAPRARSYTTWTSRLSTDCSW
jgi:hypothetical protein